MSPRDPGLLPVRWRIRERVRMKAEGCSLWEQVSQRLEREVRKGGTLRAFFPLHQPHLRHNQEMHKGQARDMRAW